MAFVKNKQRYMTKKIHIKLFILKEIIGKNRKILNSTFALRKIKEK